MGLPIAPVINEGPDIIVESGPVEYAKQEEVQHQDDSVVVVEEEEEEEEDYYEEEEEKEQLMSAQQLMGHAGKYALQFFINVVWF